MKSVLFLCLSLVSLPLFASDLNALKSDLTATCASNTDYKKFPSIISYSDQACLDQLNLFIPNFKFTGHSVQIPAHAGYLVEANLEVVSYKPAVVPVAARIESLKQVSCLIQIQTAEQTLKVRDQNKYTLEDIVRLQPDYSRTLILKFNSREVTGWRELEKCFEDVKHHLPLNGVGNIHRGTPYVIDGRPGYMIVRLFK